VEKAFGYLKPQLPHEYGETNEELLRKSGVPMTMRFKLTRVAYSEMCPTT
jgi:hypothetical protein